VPARSRDTKIGLQSLGMEAARGQAASLIEDASSA
jgi:hypothetical protein